MKLLPMKISKIAELLKSQYKIKTTQYGFLIGDTQAFFDKFDAQDAMICWSINDNKRIRIDIEKQLADKNDFFSVYVDKENIYLINGTYEYYNTDWDTFSVTTISIDKLSGDSHDILLEMVDNFSSKNSVELFKLYKAKLENLEREKFLAELQG